MNFAKGDSSMWSYPALMCTSANLFQQAPFAPKIWLPVINVRLRRIRTYNVSGVRSLLFVKKLAIDAI